MMAIISPNLLVARIRKEASTLSDMVRTDTVLLYTELKALISPDVDAAAAASTAPATSKEESGSKSQPHAARRRRSSSVKRMSSIFGDWQVTNIRSATKEMDDGAAAGPACEVGDAVSRGLRTILEQDPAPTKQELDELYAMTVLDRHRTKVPFGMLVKGRGHQRVVVIFIRHFFCGNCFGYVRALSNEMPISKLDAFDPTVKIIVIGCGDPILMPHYVKMTGCPFDIYADPSRELYSKLDFTVNMIQLEDPTKKPSYIARWSPPTFVSNLMISLGLAVRARSTDAGKISQNGGELIWSRGNLEFIHRMKHPADHLEIEELERLFST